MLDASSPTNSITSGRRFLSPREAAAVLMTTTGALAKWRCYKTGPRYVKLGGKVYYEPAALEDYISTCTITPSAS